VLTTLYFDFVKYKREKGEKSEKKKQRAKKSYIYKN